MEDTVHNRSMVVACALLASLLVSDQQPSFLAKDTLPKPSVTLLVDHVVAAPKDHPELGALVLKFPTNVKAGSEAYIFDGPRGGRVEVHVVAVGPRAKVLMDKGSNVIEKSFEKMKGRLDFKYFVAKPWFGMVNGPNSVRDRHFDNYTAIRTDGSLVVKIDASWIPRNAKAEQEATELARFVIWYAEEKPSKP
jgi:hypothetical protein